MRKILFALVVGSVAVGTTVGSSGEQCLSQWVYPGDDGKLVYLADDQGNRIPDFSNVGYGSGIVDIPDVPAQIALQADPTRRPPCLRWPGSACYRGLAGLPGLAAEPLPSAACGATGL